MKLANTETSPIYFIFKIQLFASVWLNPQLNHTHKLFGGHLSTVSGGSEGTENAKYRQNLFAISLELGRTVQTRQMCGSGVFYKGE